MSDGGTFIPPDGVLTAAVLQVVPCHSFTGEGPLPAALVEAVAYLPDARRVEFKLLLLCGPESDAFVRHLAEALASAPTVKPPDLPVLPPGFSQN